MSNTLKLGNGKWATGKDTLLSFSDTNNNYKPLPFSFSRASSGTVINKDGLIETVGAGEPRIDFKDNTKGSLLLEPTRSNLFPYSEAISNSSPKSGTFVDNFAISPDGTQNATKLTAINTDPYFYQSVAVGSGDYTISVYVKGIGSTIGKEFLLILGSGINSTPQTITGEWKRFTFSGTLSAGTTIRGLEIPNPAVSGDELLVWGLQLEQGSYATSYIPTSGSAVTRVIEVCNNGANEQVINSTEGVLYAEIKGFISQDTTEPNRYITITNGTSNERVALLLGGNLNQLRAIIYSSTQSINLSFTTSLTDVKQFNKLAVKYKSGDYAFFLNGAKIGGSTETSIFSQNTLNDFSFDVGGGTQQFRGMVKDVRLYNTALTDQELIALTTI